MTKIESGIPIPKKHIDTVRNYPFREMQVGDSVFFDGQDHNGKARLAAIKYFHRNGKGMTASIENGGIRIWRTA
jgi:hypothetical protein